MKQQINFMKSNALTFLVNILCSKYLTPTITLVCAVLSFAAYVVLGQYIEAMSGTNIMANGNFPDFTHLLAPVKGICILFTVMGLAQLSQAIYPYKSKKETANKRDKMFNAVCYAVTFYAILFVITDILFVNSPFMFPITAGASCLFVGVGTLSLISSNKQKTFKTITNFLAGLCILSWITVFGIRFGIGVPIYFYVFGAVCVGYGVLCFVWDKIEKRKNESEVVT